MAKSVVVLSEAVTVKVNGEWMTLRALMTTTSGGRRVAYINTSGKELYSEALCKSPFKGFK